jgi:two-component system, sensor histidine kinase YesM
MGRVSGNRESRRAGLSGMLKAHRLNLRLQYKLGLAFFFSFILPVIVCGVFLLFSFNRILQNNLYTNQEVYLREIKNDVDRFVIDLHRVVRSVSYNIPFTIELSKSRSAFPGEQAYTDHLSAVEAHLDGIVESEKAILGYYLITGAGAICSSDHLPDIDNPDLIITPENFAAVQSTESAVALYRPMNPSLFTGELSDMLLFAARINVLYLERKTVERGAMILLISREEIDRIVEQHNRQNEQVFLFSDTGSFIYSHNREVAFRTLPEQLSHDLSELKSGRDRIVGKPHGSLVSFDTSRFSTVKYLFASSDRRISQDTNLLYRFTIIFLFGLILVIFLLLIHLSRSISMPVTNLETIVAKLEKSNFNDVEVLAGQEHRGILSPYFSHLHSFLLSVISRINSYHRREKEHELMILQAQINPHFMYNSLNTIRVLADLEGHTKIAAAVRSLIHLLRNSIRIGVIFISIRDEVEQIRDYIALQQLRYSSSFTVVYDIEEEVLKYKCIKFVLQPIVENAIFHGIDPAGSGGIITIAVRRKNGRIAYTVHDNGKGFDLQQQREILEGGPDQGHLSGSTEKIGLRNVNLRLETYFGAESRLNIESSPGRGTSIRFTIPAEVYEGS